METRASILLIDDDELNILTLQKILNDEFIVFSETSGAKGVESAKLLQPDVILLDIVMPEMNGFEVITLLQADNLTKNIPVIFVTGFGDLQSEEQALYLGAVDFINKPFTSHVVKLRIRNQLRILRYVRMGEQLSQARLQLGNFARKSFIANVDDELNRCARISKSVALVLINLDDFSMYNEKYGRESGEILLLDMQNVIGSRVTRPGDKMSRWIDDEFIVLLPNTNEDGTRIVADDILRIIAMHTLDPSNGYHEGITASAGLHIVSPKLNDRYILEYSVNEFLADARLALQAAKANGKNTMATKPRK